MRPRPRPRVQTARMAAVPCRLRLYRTARPDRLLLSGSFPALSPAVRPLILLPGPLLPPRSTFSALRQAHTSLRHQARSSARSKFASGGASGIEAAACHLCKLHPDTCPARARWRRGPKCTP